MKFDPVRLPERHQYDCEQLTSLLLVFMDSTTLLYDSTVQLKIQGEVAQNTCPNRTHLHIHSLIIHVRFDISNCVKLEHA